MGKEITSEFKLEIGQRLIDYNEDGSIKRDITIIERKRDRDKSGRLWRYYKYECNKCGFDGGKHYSIKEKKYKEKKWVVENLLLNGVSCSCCCSNSQIIVTGINDIATTHPHLTKFFVNIEDIYTHTYGCHDKILFKCLECGYIYKYTIKDFIRYNGILCKKCGDGISYPNKFANELLNQLNEIYKFNCLKCEYSPEWINPKAYDFYFELNNKKYILEMDGGWHYKYNNKSGQTAEESKAIDNYKDEMAKQHGIEVIRINCDYDWKDKFEWIKQNIINNEKFKKTFNLSNIDWNKCDELGITNRVKMVCNIWSDYPDWTIKDVSEYLNINRRTILKYLTDGNKHNWCDYNSQKEIYKSQEKQSKPIKVFDMDMNLIYMFQSIGKCSSQSEELFGIKLNNNNISQTCKGRQKQHKNYIFRYASKEEYAQWTKEQINRIITQ